MVCQLQFPLNYCNTDLLSWWYNQWCSHIHSNATKTFRMHHNIIIVNFLGKACGRQEDRDWCVSRWVWEYDTRYSGDQAYIFKNLSCYGRPIGVVASGKIGPGSFSFQFQFVVPFYVLSSFLFENIPDKISSTYVSYKIKGRVVTGRSYVDYQDSVKVY